MISVPDLATGIRTGATIIDPEEVTILINRTNLTTSDTYFGKFLFGVY